MSDCNDQGCAAGSRDPPTIVPDTSTQVSAAAGPVFREHDAPPLAACFVDFHQSQSSASPLLAANKPPYAAGGTDVESRSSMILSPGPTVVLPTADAVKLDIAPTRNRSRTAAQAQTPQEPAPGVDPLLQLLLLPAAYGSPEVPPQPRPGSEQAPPPNSPAWQNLVREVGSAAATRPSLCACKKLAVAAVLSDDGDDGDDSNGDTDATQRPGRVCANRGKEADCFYRAFDDAPIVPSTTVSNKTLSLLLHVHKPEPAAPAGGGRMGERVEGAEDNGGDAERDGDPGGVSPEGIKEGCDVIKDEDSSGDVGEGEGQATAAAASLGDGAASGDKSKVVSVEIRRWLMDGVASVHCADAALREAMLRLVPPELGQTHLSPGGDGQLIALHVAAVTLLVESLPSLPGVVKVEGADKTAGIFTTAQVVPPTAITPARRPVSSQQPKPAARQPRPRQHTPSGGRSRPMAAPVPIRASEMVAPSIWDLANVDGGGSSNGSGSGKWRGETSGWAAQAGCGGASSCAGGLGYSGATPVDTAGGGARVDGTAALMLADSTLFSAETDPQQLPGWGSKAGSRSRYLGNGGNEAGGAGDIGGAWADSSGLGGVAYGNDADIYRQGRHQVSAPSVFSSSSSSGGSSSSSVGSSSGSYDFRCSEASAYKRQKTSSGPSALAGVATPVGQHLQGYASLFSGDATFTAPPLGNTFGGMPALAYSASGKLGAAAGIGGSIGLGDLAGDTFGASGGGVEVDVGSAWADAVFDSESASSSSPFLSNAK